MKYGLIVNERLAVKAISERLELSWTVLVVGESNERGCQPQAAQDTERIEEQRAGAAEQVQSLTARV